MEDPQDAWPAEQLFRHADLCLVLHPLASGLVQARVHGNQAAGVRAR